MRDATLRAHPNVIPIAEERQRRRDAERADEPVRITVCAPPGCFVDWRSEPSRKSHPAAQALLAGLMQGTGERERDAALASAGQWLRQAATQGLPRPGPPQRQAWWRRWLGLRSRIG